MNSTDLARETQHLKNLAIAEHDAAVDAAQAQFRRDKDAIDAAFDAEFDCARDKGFVTIEDSAVCKPAPGHHTKSRWHGVMPRAAADNTLNLAIGRIFDRKP